MNTILQPLAAGFRLGVKLRDAAYRRGWLKTRRLNRPVVSVGNLTVGGTGKTPLVAWIAQRLLNRGWRPAILTRGYGRCPRSGIIAVEPGPDRAPQAREVGDEPALLARLLPDVPIVVGADRYRAGRLAEDRFNVDVHLLDDGFQHLALARDVDMLLVDVTQEFSDGALLPAGRLREPCSALERVHLVVLTRLELGDSGPLEERVRQINPLARIFHSATRLCGLADLESGRPLTVEALRGKPVGAFCGIGNPRAFSADLRRWGFCVVAEFSFPDHQVYSTRALRRLAARARDAGAAVLVTTEKDAINFPPLWRSDLPIVACVIQAEMREAEAFEEALMACLETSRRGNDRPTGIVAAGDRKL